ncbi:MAG: YHS domain-containing protein [Gammaproteobacteria bacterium]|nr:YHS domain-containing protein [Gammaproteobacteria bacterium]
MEGLLSFLFFAGVFYLMMRFGCGTHMTHGSHGGHGHGDDTVEKYTDPVCGMPVDTKQGYGKMHEGRLFRFCSRNCLDRFEADPGKYLKGDAS